MPSLPTRKTLVTGVPTPPPSARAGVPGPPPLQGPLPGAAGQATPYTPAPIPLPSPAAAQAASTNLFRAIFELWIQSWKDAFSLFFWVLRHPSAFFPLLIVFIVLGLVLFAIQAMLLNVGTWVVLALSVFFYVRAIDRYSLHLFQRNHPTPPQPAEPRHLTTIMRLLGRPETPSQPEGAFRHYIARLAWWDFRVIVLEAFQSMAGLARPLTALTQASSANMLTRAVALPLMGVVGIVALVSMVFFAILGLLHVVALTVLYAVGFVYPGASTAAGASEPEVAAPRRTAGYLTLMTWAAVAMLPFLTAATVRFVPEQPSVPQSTAPSAAFPLNVEATAPIPGPAERRAPRVPAPDSSRPSNTTVADPTTASSESSSADAPTTAPVTVPVDLDTPAPPSAAAPMDNAPPTRAADASSATRAPAASATPTSGPGDTSAGRTSRNVAAPTVPVSPRAASTATVAVPPAPPASSSTETVASTTPPPAGEAVAVSPVVPSAPVPASAPAQDSPIRPATPPAHTGPTSGRLSYNGAPIPQNGEVVFSNLPPGQLRLTYDTSAWSHRLAPAADGTQRLILRSRKPGLQTKADVAWSSAQQ